AHVERDEVVLPAVVVVVAEEPDAEVRIVENESAEIAHERLDPETRREEVVVVRQVAEMDFAERFLERVKIFASRRVARAFEIVRQRREAGPESGKRIAEDGENGYRRHGCEPGSTRIGIDRVIFRHPNVVVVRHEEEPQRPDHRLERRLAFEQVDADREIVREKELLASPEKLGAVRPRRANAARDRKLARFELKEIVQSEIEKNVLTDNRRVAFELALKVRVPEAKPAGLVRSFIARIGVALPAAEPDEPAIRHRLGARQ